MRVFLNDVSCLFTHRGGAIVSGVNLVTKPAKGFYSALPVQFGKVASLQTVRIVEILIVDDKAWTARLREVRMLLEVSCCYESN